MAPVMIQSNVQNGSMRVRLVLATADDKRAATCWSMTGIAKQVVERCRTCVNVSQRKTNHLCE